MIRDLGIITPGLTIYLPFHTFSSDDPSASMTLTGLATSDVEVYKDGSMTQRGSDNGYALLDTDGIDLDGITGIHGLSIDLADNSTAGFYAAGSQYWVVISSVTVDAATVNFILATFRLGYAGARLNTTIATLASQTSFTLTAGPAEDDALNGMWLLIHDVASAVQVGHAIIDDYTGSTKTVTLAAGTTFTAATTDNVSVMGPMPLQPTVSARKLDVSTGGEAGVDWANVGSPTTSLNLSGTTVATTQKVDVETIETNPVVNGGTVTFPTTATLASTTNITAGTVTTATNVTTVNGLAANVITATSINADAITAAKLHSDVTTELQTGLATAASIAALNNLSAAQVNTEVDTALVDIHLDHLLAATYDPASKPGAADALLNELVESDAGVSRYTANALEQAPSGTGASASAIADEVQTRTIAAVTVVNGLAANVITAAATHADFTTEIQTGLATQTSVDDLPTNAELATALGTADDAVLSAISTLSGKVDTIDDFLDLEIAAILAAVDTEVAAIKAKTDALTFTVANVLDANIQRINDVTVNGDGAGTPWGP